MRIYHLFNACGGNTCLGTFVKIPKERYSSINENMKIFEIKQMLINEEEDSPDVFFNCEIPLVQTNKNTEQRKIKF